MNEILIIKKDDLDAFKSELVNELMNQLKPLINGAKTPPAYLKSKDVKKILGCSDSTLQHYRNTGKLEFKKVGGSFFYTNDSLEKMMNSESKIVPLQFKRKAA